MTDNLDDDDSEISLEHESQAGIGQENVGSAPGKQGEVWKG